MIRVTNRDTCRNAFVPEEHIVSMEEMLDRTEERDYPFTRIHVIDRKEKYDYFVDAVESKKYIENLILEASNDDKKKEVKPHE